MLDVKQLGPILENFLVYFLFIPHHLLLQAASVDIVLPSYLVATVSWCLHIALDIKSPAYSPKY